MDLHFSTDEFKSKKNKFNNEFKEKKIDLVII